jgi:hypothetical protein
MRVDIKEVVTERKRASGSKGAEALRQTSVTARSGSTQPMVRVESKRLLFSSVSYTSAEKAEIIGEMTSSFRGREFAVFSKLVTQV